MCTNSIVPPWTERTGKPDRPDGRVRWKMPSSGLECGSVAQLGGLTALTELLAKFPAMRQPLVAYATAPAVQSGISRAIVAVLQEDKK